MPHFVINGKKYEQVLKPTMGELAYCEHQSGFSLNEMSGMERTCAGILLSVRRAQLVTGELPLMTWAEVIGMTQDDWEIIQDPPPAAPEPEPELPEDQWPLDPKDAGTPTVPPFASGPYDPQTPPEQNVWMTDYSPTTGSSPTPTDGPPRPFAP